jgi:hypothetical protein
LAIKHLQRPPANDPVLYFFFNSKQGEGLYQQFLASLLYGLVSHAGIEIPGALETFIDDYLRSRANTLDPDCTRLEDLFIRSCQEHSSTIYVSAASKIYQTEIAKKSSGLSADSGIPKDVSF